MSLPAGVRSFCSSARDQLACHSRQSSAARLGTTVVLDSMIGAYFQQIMEFIFIFYCTELGNVRRTIDLQLRTKIVGHPNVIQRSAEQIRALCNGTANRDTASTRSFSCQMLRRSVAVIDQVLKAGDEISSCVFFR